MQRAMIAGLSMCSGLTLAGLAWPTHGAHASAQAVSDADAADSSAQARAEYRRAREKLAAGDTLGALEQLARAARAFPPQPAYADMLLALSTAARNITYATMALQFANTIGIAVPSSAQSKTAALAGSASAGATERGRTALGILMREQDRLRTSINRGVVLRTLGDSALFPECIARDPRSGALYVSSIAHRNVRIVDPGGRERWLMREAPADAGALYGLAVDTARNVVWVASSTSPVIQENDQKRFAAVFAISMNDGRVVKRMALQTVEGNASPGDLALAPNGDVFISDAAAGILWRVPSGTDSVIALRHALFRSLQGVVPADGAGTFWVADYSHGLLHVTLSGNNAVDARRVADATGNTTVGFDGLVRHGNSLIAVQNLFAPSQVVQMHLDATGQRIVRQQTIDRNDVALSPTGGVMIDDAFIYVSNSLWDLVDANGKLPANTAGRATRLLSITLTSVRASSARMHH